MRTGFLTKEYEMRVSRLRAGMGVTITAASHRMRSAAFPPHHKTRGSLSILHMQSPRQTKMRAFSQSLPRALIPKAGAEVRGSSL